MQYENEFTEKNKEKLLYYAVLATLHAHGTDRLR